jgi:hypothetical protein
MENLKNQINNYLTTHFNYDPSIDEKALKHSQSLGKYEKGRWDFKPNQNLIKCILDNLNYKMLFPTLLDDNEPISLIEVCYDYDYISSIELNNKLRKMLLNITEKEVQELLDNNINIETLIYLSIFHICELPNEETLFEICDINYVDYCNCYTPTAIGLLNKKYDFKVLKLILSIKDKFNISNEMIVECMDENFHDYATYSIGGYNSEYRNEFNMYYNDILRPYLISKEEK